MGNLKTRIDISGQRFGRLTAISYHHTDPKTKYAMWFCSCDCGNTLIVSGKSLRSGNTKSCGCLNIDSSTRRIVDLNTTHGEAHSKLYRIWGGMRSRCKYDYNGTHNSKYYHDRGIRVCEEWESYEAFRDWALANGYHDGNRTECTIDRIDNNKGYSPENCRWVTTKQQNRNRRSNKVIEFNGESHCLVEWSEITGIPKTALQQRFRSGRFTVERALTLPVQNKGRRASIAKESCV